MRVGFQVKSLFVPIPDDALNQSMVWFDARHIAHRLELPQPVSQ